MLTKPKLVYFQWDHSDLPQFLQLHMNLHVKCLSETFDVILINHNCDYQQICDTYEPDLALFESGYRTSLSRKITVRNTFANQEVPKLGFHNGDPWCECRTGFISDMAHWGIDTFFTISTTTAENTPDIADKLFFWPNFIDDEIFRDYGLAKIVPVLFTGYINPLYPWREKIYKRVSNCYPSLTFPHLGYESYSPMMIQGEQYARTINASWFVPACGTLAKEVVRKHFEIPGSNSCLITEKSASLEAAGFVDMQNCVFADENDILDKLDFLLQNKTDLQKIISAGYQLVQSRHTLKQRDQIFEWFMLNKDLKSNQQIVQLNPFESLKVVEKLSGIKSTPIFSYGIHLALLKQGDEKLWAGEYDEAEALYLKCLNYIHWICEPKLKLAICNLFKGRPNDSFNWLNEPLLNNLRDYKAIDADPIEWAYLIISLLCQGKLNEATIRAHQFPNLHHIELDRIRWVINCLQGNEIIMPEVENQLLRSRQSIHQLPQRNFDDWISNLCVMLNASRQFDYSEILHRSVLIEKNPSIKEEGMSIKLLKLYQKRKILGRIKWLDKIGEIFVQLQIANPRPGLPAISEIDYIIRLARWAKIDSIKRFVIKHLSPTYKYFRLPKLHNDEFAAIFHDYLHKGEVKRVIIIGESNLKLGEEIDCKKKSNNDETEVFWIKFVNSTYFRNVRKTDNMKVLKVPETTDRLLDLTSSELIDCIRKVKQDNKFEFFDLVVFDKFSGRGVGELDELWGAKFIILNNINSQQIFDVKRQLNLDPNYVMVTQNPMSKDGFAIFQRS